MVSKGFYWFCFWSSEGYVPGVYLFWLYFGGLEPEEEAVKGDKNVMTGHTRPPAGKYILLLWSHLQLEHAGMMKFPMMREVAIHVAWHASAKSGLLPTMLSFVFHSEYI